MKMGYCYQQKSQLMPNYDPIYQTLPRQTFMNVPFFKRTVCRDSLLCDVFTPAPLSSLEQHASDSLPYIWDVLAF